jgi:hypothetical protein
MGICLVGVSTEILMMRWPRMGGCTTGGSGACEADETGGLVTTGSGACETGEACEADEADETGGLVTTGSGACETDEADEADETGGLVTTGSGACETGEDCTADGGGDFATCDGRATSSSGMRSVIRGRVFLTGADSGAGLEPDPDRRG